MNNQSKQSIAKNLVLKCGVPPTLAGYKYLTEAVELYATGNYKLTEVYEELAESQDLLPQSVLRDISYAIAQSYNISKRLSAVVGLEIPDEQIRAGLVISYLAIELNDMLSE